MYLSSCHVVPKNEIQSISLCNASSDLVVPISKTTWNGTSCIPFDDLCSKPGFKYLFVSCSKLTGAYLRQRGKRPHWFLYRSQMFPDRAGRTKKKRHHTPKTLFFLTKKRNVTKKVALQQQATVDLDCVVPWATYTEELSQYFRKGGQIQPD